MQSRVSAFRTLSSVNKHLLGASQEGEVKLKQGVKKKKGHAKLEPPGLNVPKLN